MASLRRLWNVAPIRITNLIDCGQIDKFFNKSLSNAAVKSYNDFLNTRSDLSGSGISINDDSSSTDNGSNSRRRRKKKASSSSTSTSNPPFNNAAKENVDPKTGLTANDHFFEHQRINGYSQQTLSQIPEIDRLQELLSCEVQTYLTSLGNNKSNQIASRLMNDDVTIRFDMWAAIQVGDGAYHKDHVHEDVFVSGVYYAATPNGCAPLVLHRPTRNNNVTAVSNDGGGGGGEEEEVGDDSDYNDNFVIHPKDGQVAIFPPWLLHGVPPISTTATNNNIDLFPRISFAFNVSGPYITGIDPWDITKS